MILLDANGLSLVLITFLSISLSHISFAIHPNPLTNNPPNMIFRIIDKFGLPLGVNHKLHPAGINKISLPEGLFQRKISMIGLIFKSSFSMATVFLFHNFNNLTITSHN